MTNGVMHAKTALMLDICSDEDWLEISVADDSPWPVRRRPHRQDVAGDLIMLLETEQHLGQHLDERDVRLDVGMAGTLAGGRGLLLVEALADQWGVTPQGSGKAVWARLALNADLLGTAGSVACARQTGLGRWLTGHPLRTGRVGCRRTDGGSSQQLSLPRRHERRPTASTGSRAASDRRSPWARIGAWTLSQTHGSARDCHGRPA